MDHTTCVGSSLLWGSLLSFRQVTSKVKNSRIKSSWRFAVRKNTEETATWRQEIRRKIEQWPDGVRTGLTDGPWNSKWWVWADKDFSDAAGVLALWLLSWVEPGVHVGSEQTPVHCREPACWEATVSALGASANLTPLRPMVSPPHTGEEAAFPSASFTQHGKLKVYFWSGSLYSWSMWLITCLVLVSFWQIPLNYYFPA